MTRVRASLATLVDDFERFPKDIAIVVRRGLRERRSTYGDLAQFTRRFAEEVARRGIVKGDRVLIWGENGPEWVAAFFGCVLRGVLAVPIDAAGSVDFAQRVERDVSPKLIVGEASKLALLSSSVPFLAFENFESSLPAEAAQAIPDLDPETPLQIVFTSGSTGDPKGIVHTHRNVLASLLPIEKEMDRYLKFERPFHPIRILHTLPLSHVFGQFMGLWLPPLMAAEMHYESRLAAAELMAHIRAHRISVLAAVPRILDLLQAEALRRFPGLETRVEQAASWKAWRRWWEFRDVHRFFGFKFWAFICGGASLSSGGERFWTRLGFVVVQGYGMTETTALVSLNHPFRAARGTIGQVLPGREVRLTAEGEVLVRGETISTATWRQGRMQKEESDWLSTGDLAEFDEQGNLRFRGRKKDVIVTSAGLNIYPEDLESALLAQPGVKAAAVVATDAGNGLEPRAVLLLQPSADARAAVAGANSGLAEFQQIRRWNVWPEPDFPRTSTGKILKREISARLIEALAEEDAEEQPLDSLARVELQSRLEQQYGVTLDDAAIQSVQNVREAKTLLAQRSASRVETADPHLYPRWPWNPVVQDVRALFQETLARLVTRFLAKPSVRRSGSELQSPALIVCNHVTSYDGAFILYALPGHIRRRMAIAMSAEMLLDFRKGRNQGGWLLDLLSPLAYLLITGLYNVFPLPQFSGFRKSFRHAGEAVDRGYSVVIFPEGRRSADGSAQPFKSGAGLLWKDLGIPAIPIRLDGLGQIKAAGGSWFRTGKISVSVGEPLTLDPAQSPEELTERLRKAVFPG